MKTLQTNYNTDKLDSVVGYSSLNTHLRLKWGIIHSLPHGDWRRAVSQKPMMICVTPLVYTSFPYKPSAFGITHLNISCLLHVLRLRFQLDIKAVSGLLWPLFRLNFAYFLSGTFASDPVCVLPLRELVCVLVTFSRIHSTLCFWFCGLITWLVLRIIKPLRLCMKCLFLADEGLITNSTDFHSA